MLNTDHKISVLFLLCFFFNSFFLHTCGSTIVVSESSVGSDVVKENGCFLLPILHVKENTKVHLAVSLNLRPLFSP